MQFQVLSTDEYRQTSILGTFPSLEKALNFMHSQVSDLNFNNALTSDDRMRSIEAYAVHFLDNDGEMDISQLYSGNTSDGKPRVLVGNDEHFERKVVTSDMNLKIFIGEHEGTTYYFKTPKNETVDSLDSEFLEGKTEFFIRIT